jgi:calnexin
VQVHFIFRHRNPVTGSIEEKHLKKAPTVKADKISHLYTLIVRPDNSFEIKIDGEQAAAGSLLEDFAPPVNPPREIDDPTDVKPADWVDSEMCAACAHTVQR